MNACMHVQHEYPLPAVGATALTPAVGCGRVQGERTPYSHHGAERTQQRAIEPLIVDWVLAYGASKRVNGATRYFFDKKARQCLERDVGAIVVRRLADKLDVVAVVSDEGMLITAYHRCERMLRR